MSSSSTKLYKTIVKPILFNFDAEKVHNAFTGLGENLAKYELTKDITSYFLEYKSTNLEKEVNGLKFSNPVGLAAGFDYDGKLVGIMKKIGFGFNTVGTVTAKPYEGNKPPRMARLPKSKSLLVNKGFKSQGVYEIAKRLNNPKYKDIMFGVSVGSSNIPEVNTITKAIEDYKETFTELKKNNLIKYYELNISCPNTSMTENFTNITNFDLLLKNLETLQLNKPIFIKMPNEISLEICDQLVESAFKYNYKSFIFSNLVKDRNNKFLNREEVQKVASLKGNFSGLPTKEGSINLITHYRKKYGKDIILVGCGGIFTPQDALERLNAGADLIQLITGMIYEGPGLIKEINTYLSKNK